MTTYNLARLWTPTPVSRIPKDYCYMYTSISQVYWLIAGWVSRSRCRVLLQELQVMPKVYLKSVSVEYEARLQWLMALAKTVQISFIFWKFTMFFGWVVVTVSLKDLCLPRRKLEDCKAAENSRSPRVGAISID